MKKVSEITVNEIANYLRLVDINENEISEVNMYLNIAKSYISNYTGIPISTDKEDEETLDSYEDLAIVVFVLCQDMYDNRTLYVNSSNMNNMVQTVLDMHTRNNI